MDYKVGDRVVAHWHGEKNEGTILGRGEEFVWQVEFDAAFSDHFDRVRLFHEDHLHLIEKVEVVPIDEPNILAIHHRFLGIDPDGVSRVNGQEEDGTVNGRFT